MKKYLSYPSILEGYQAYEMAGSCDLQKENAAATEWFRNVAVEDFFEEEMQMPKYHWFICHIDEVDADLYYDYGADYYFLVREVETEGS